MKKLSAVAIVTTAEGERVSYTYMELDDSGNITSQRANIRAKMGLQKGDNLKESLRERMRLHEEQYGPTT